MSEVGMKSLNLYKKSLKTNVLRAHVTKINSADDISPLYWATDTPVLDFW